MLVSNTPEVKQLNTERIRRKAQEKASWTKAEISRETKLSMATCNNILNSLLESGEVKLVEMEATTVGRPASRFCYNADFQHVAGLFINNECGKNTIFTIVADALGHTLRNRTIHPEQITIPVLETALRETLAGDELVQYLAVGVPGIIDNGVIDQCDVEILRGIDIKSQLENTFGIPTEVRNDMDFISKGTCTAVQKNKGTIATMYFPFSEGTIGCGYTVDGKSVTGATKFIGEIAYVGEAYGLDRREQSRILRSHDREKYRDFAAKMAIVLITAIDPEIIMIMGNQTNQQDIDDIARRCADIVSANHVPKLLFDNDIEGSYARGLVCTALDRLQFPILR